MRSAAARNVRRRVFLYSRAQEGQDRQERFRVGGEGIALIELYIGRHARTRGTAAKSARGRRTFTNGVGLNARRDGTRPRVLAYRRAREY